MELATEGSLTKQLPDIQMTRDTRGVAIDKVGVCDIRFPLELPLRGGGAFNTVAMLALTVGLPDTEKGTHMSRLMRALNDKEWRSSLSPSTSFDVLERLQKSLNAEEAHLKMTFPMFLAKKAPVTGEVGLMDYDCDFEAMLNCVHSDRLVGVRVNVATVCPCSKEISDRGAHNQRGLLKISVRPTNDEMVWYEELIEIAEQSASCALYPVLKRPDEKWVTETAYDNPKFVEDVVRDAVLRLRSMMRSGRIVWFYVSSTNFESIHSHNAFAEVERGTRGPLLGFGSKSR